MGTLVGKANQSPVAASKYYNLYAPLVLLLSLSIFATPHHEHCLPFFLLFSCFLSSAVFVLLYLYYMFIFIRITSILLLFALLRRRPVA